jgi:putative SOS response-associated peptidase YedK
MPVIVDPKQFEPWLSGAAGADLLKPAPDALLQMWPVSRRANSSRASGDDPTLIEGLAA